MHQIPQSGGRLLDCLWLHSALVLLAVLLVLLVLLVLSRAEVRNAIAASWPALPR